jgi:hypothetical protein
METRMNLIIFCMTLNVSIAFIVSILDFWLYRQKLVFGYEPDIFG